MTVRAINSRHNARLKELRSALTSPGRDRLAGIEGPHLLQEATRAGLRVECVFAAQGAERFLETLRLPPETEVLLLPKSLLDAALTTETPQPVAALIQPPAWSWDDLLQAAPRPAQISGQNIRRADKGATRQPAAAPAQKSHALILILAGLQDPGNLGTILRSAEAFGATGIVSLPGTVNAWNSKVVRASAGSVFRLPLIAATAEQCFQRVHHAGIQIWAATARSATPALEANLAGPTALLIGNEGNGLPAELAAKADAAITIPCPGPVESLNAAVAASVLLYESARQRAAATAAPPARRRTR